MSDRFSRPALDDDPEPAPVTRSVTLTVTEEHLAEAADTGVHPVALAILDAIPGTDEAGVIREVTMVRDGAYLRSGDEVTLLQLDETGAAFCRAYASLPRAVRPVTFQAEVISP